ncbi:MAG: VCBS repeat-containing protein [Bacteroidota bacterium]
MMTILILSACQIKKEHVPASQFTLIPPSHSSISFQNNLIEDEEFNIIEYLYFYNGGGVAIGDINNDGLSDIYFSSNQGPNKLYLNKGNFRFEDITSKAGVEGGGNWKTGITMADVNADGLLDIYLCGVGRYKNFNGFNQLFINNGDLTFTKSADAFGLNFEGFSTHAAFFDYDRDGDLDMYLLNHSVHPQRSYGNISMRNQVDSLSGDRLYQNQYTKTGASYFKDVTKEAGILSSQLGYGLGIGISDFNRDGFPDIYVSNDFAENDYLYINLKNGTFSQESDKSLAHTSRFSMGNEMADLNNDLWTDILTMDMLPRDEAVIKTSAGEDSYEVYKFKLNFGYGKQVSRNTLQVNRGRIDSGRVVFSDVAQAAGLPATDWSWCPLAVDFDGDGLKDVFISNGIVRRPNDLDYINFISNDSIQEASKESDFILANMMPEGKVSNFIFKNRGDLTFEDKTKEWGLYLPGFSNGAAYGDLDNDGDPDLVVNQINGDALLYQNNSASANFLKVNLSAKSIKANQKAVGATVTVTSGDQVQMQELFPSRGWCSSSDYAMTFGLPTTDDSVNVKIIWPDGKVSQQTVSSNEVIIEYDHRNQFGESLTFPTPLLQLVSKVNIKHNEDDFNAFNRESLIPHMLSTEGPPLAVADINQDGLDDFFIGGAKGQAGSIFKQKPNGELVLVKSNALAMHVLAEDTDAAFFDADGDGDQDLVVVSGGQEEMKEFDLLTPRLYLNDGKGNFTYSSSAFSKILLHASCVRPYDYDSDGDVDLFIGASVMPFLYGMSPVSFLLQNKGKGVFQFDPSWLGQSTFDNPTQVRPGMVKDAAWIDINKDNLQDLVLAGEWMPVTVLIQQKDHRFLNMANAYGLDNTKGWWNTIEVDDFDGDGDDDLMLGNLGLNSRIKASQQKPLSMYLGDFDSNGGSDHIMVYFNGDSSYPFSSRDQLVKQIPSLKKKFLHYMDYRDVKLEDIITPLQKGNSALMKVEQLKSVFLRNDGDKFELIPLPMEAQYFPVYGIKSCDLNDDGIPDVLLTGNLSATQPDFGSYDAGVGLVLMGDGKGNFEPIRPDQSGFITLGEGRDIAIMKEADTGKLIYLVSRNNQTLLTFRKK